MERQPCSNPWNNTQMSGTTKIIFPYVFIFIPKSAMNKNVFSTTFIKKRNHETFKVNAFNI